MITVNLMQSSSPVEKINKSLTTIASFDCVFKNETSILKPTILINTNTDITGCNYMYIPSLSRYYFIDDIVSIKNGLWQISGHVDVLETYSSEILSNTAVIKRQQNKYNLYLDDPEYHVYNSERIQTLEFSNTGFSKTLRYMLVVNGG